MPANRTINGDAKRLLSKIPGTYLKRFTTKKQALYHVISELNQLNKEFKYVRVNHYGVLTVRTIDNIVFGDIGLGKFEVNISHTYLPYPVIEVIALTPVLTTYDRIRHEIFPSGVVCPHPHIFGDDLCLGKGEGVTYNHLNNLDLVEALSVINSVLHTYSPNTAYIKRIRQYKQVYCELCRTWIHPDNASLCKECGMYSCKKHSRIFCKATGCHVGRCKRCNTQIEESFICPNHKRYTKPAIFKRLAISKGEDS